MFTYGHIITYLVNRNVADGLPAADFKSINRAPNNLFEGGYVQNIKLEGQRSIFLFDQTAFLKCGNTKYTRYYFLTQG